MEILASPDGLEFLTGMWGVVEQELPADQQMGAAGLTVEVFSIDGDIHAVVVTMPPPLREFEAFFVALVARLEGEHAFARVFSLVLTTPPPGEPDAAMLEWNAKGEHEFIQERADISPGDFVDAIERVLPRTAGRAP